MHVLRTHFAQSLFLKMNLGASPRQSSRANDLDIGVNPTVDLVNPAFPDQFESGALKQLSKVAIQKTLEKTNGNISLAAKLLSISRNTLYRYLKN